MTQKRPNGTTRPKKNSTETQVCSRCSVTKDVIEYQPYWYQPKLGGQPHGDPVRRRYKVCRCCAIKRN